MVPDNHFYLDRELVDNKKKNILTSMFKVPRLFDKTRYMCKYSFRFTEKRLATTKLLV